MPASHHQPGEYAPAEQQDKLRDLRGELKKAPGTGKEQLQALIGGFFPEATWSLIAQEKYLNVPQPSLADPTTKLC